MIRPSQHPKAIIPHKTLITFTDIAPELRSKLKPPKKKYRLIVKRATYKARAREMRNKKGLGVFAEYRTNKAIPALVDGCKGSPVIRPGIIPIVNLLGDLVHPYPVKRIVEAAWVCLRCHYVWHPRKQTAGRPPKRCPGCKSLRWQQPQSELKLNGGNKAFWLKVHHDEVLAYHESNGDAATMVKYNLNEHSLAKFLSGGYGVPAPFKRLPAEVRVKHRYGKRALSLEDFNIEQLRQSLKGHGVTYKSANGFANGILSL